MKFSKSFLSKFFTHVHDDYYLPGNLASFSNVLTPNRKHNSQLEHWLDSKISSPGGAQQLASTAPLDFADMRVRNYTEDEIEPNREYLAVGSKIAFRKSILEVCEVFKLVVLGELMDCT